MNSYFISLKHSLYNLFYINLLFIFIYNTQADNKSEFFKNVLPPDQEYKVVHDYYNKLWDILINDSNKTPIAQYLVTPAFLSVYALTLYKKDSISVLKFKICKNKLMGSIQMDKKAVVYSTEMIIRPDLSKLIYDFIKIANEYIKRQPKINGKDGETYFFTIWDENTGEMNIANTWSPYKKSLANEIVKISEKVADYAHKGGGNELKLIDKLNEIIDKIEKIH